VRWKPPPASSKRLGGDADIGWRVEFRSMEVQLTDFENAAFTVFIVLVSRVILYFDLNLYQPLSKVDENMKRAQTRDALLAQKFWFCQTLMPSDGCGCPGEYANSGPAPKAPPSAEDRKLPRDKVAGVVGELPMQEISVLEMLQGKGDFKGLVPMIMAYLDVIGTDAITLRGVSTYLDFIVARAAGELMTPAAWQRKYVRSHPDYKFDSQISSRIAADLMAKCHRIGKGLDKVPELHGAFHIEPVHAAATEALLVSNLPLQHSASSVGRAVERYAQRSELMAKKRKLQGELEQQKRQIQHTQQSLSTIESELEAYELPAMEGARLTPPVPASGV
jgi:glutamate--cysteine ligase catalytic subunit